MFLSELPFTLITLDGTFAMTSNKFKISNIQFEHWFWYPKIICIWYLIFVMLIKNDLTTKYHTKTSEKL